MNEREPMKQGSRPTADPREERLRALLQAAYPAAEPDEALARRVAEMAARHVARRAQPMFSFGWRRALGAVAAAALLAVLGLTLAHRHGGSPTRHSTRTVRGIGPHSLPRSLPSVESGNNGFPARKPGFRAKKSLVAPPVSRSMDDMAYVNCDAEQALRPWVAAPPDESEQIEAQVRRKVRVKDDFVTIPLPRLASTAPRQIIRAVESYKREAAIVDPRLFRKVTLALKGASLDDLCAALQAQTGVPFHAARGVGDDKVTVFVDNQPARDVMRALVQLFGYTWLRSKEALGVRRWALGDKADETNAQRPTPNASYRYELLQDLRSQLDEEALRNRDMSAALLALDREMQAYQPYMDQSIDQLRTRLAHARGAESRRLSQLVQFGGWAGVQLYDRLAPVERAALLNGQPLVFSVDAVQPDRRLPAEWVRPILQSINPPGEKPASETPGVTLSTVGLQLDRSEPERLVLNVTLDTAGPKAGESGQSVVRLVDGTGPSMKKPDNAAANHDLRSQKPFEQAVSIRPEPSRARLRGEKPDPGEARWVFSSDVWEAIHRATGQPIVADFYTHFYPAADISVEGAPLFDVLCRAGDAMGVRWRKEGSFLLCRSSSFFWDRLKEVPNRYLERWQQEKHDHGGLPLDALLEMASLPDDQLSGAHMGGAIEDCRGLPEWHIVDGERGFRSRIPHPGISPDMPAVQVRTYTGQFPWLWIRFWYPPDLRAELRFFSTLRPEQRQRALQPDGLAFTALAPEQQRGFLQLWEQVEGLREQHLGHRSGLDPQDLVNARFSAEYIPAGWYYWSAPWRQPEPHPRVLPHVAGRTAAEALAAARRLDPGARPNQIHPCPDGQFAPSLWIGAIPSGRNTAQRRP